jgi:hypothetical protein
MCGEHLQNGQTSDKYNFETPDNLDDEAEMLENFLGNKNFGMHEDISHFLRCSLAEKSMGRMKMDQYGFECEAERKSYPFEFYSGWFDIFHLTNTGECVESSAAQPLCVERNGGKYNYRMKNSDLCDGEMFDFYSPVEILQNINEKDCGGDYRVFGYYLTSELAASQEKPKKKCLQLHSPKRCSQNFKTTPGILGNSLSGQLPSVTWQLPVVEKPVSCVVRLRSVW